MRIGVLIRLRKSVDIRQQFADLRESGFSSCQMLLWPYGEDNFFDLGMEEKAAEIKAACEEYGITISAFWCGWPGRAIWDNYSGPLTLGIVPPHTRDARVKAILKGSDFAKLIGIKNVVTHVGYIPVTHIHDPNYFNVIEALKTIVLKCRSNGQNFLFETGQEPPIVLKRAILDIEQGIGKGNVGINLDPANLLCYGMGNPLTALDTFGEYVMGIHAKDATVCTDPYSTAFEVPLGQGAVNYPAFIAKLKEIGYDSDITIEREITGEQQKKDIAMAKALLEELIGG